MSANPQHSGADLDTALFSALQPSLGGDPRTLRPDDRGDRPEQFIDRGGEDGGITDPLCLLAADLTLRYARFVVTERVRRPVIGEGQ